MPNIKEILGITAVVISIFSLFPYISDIVKKKTKPHLYTWVIWTPLTFMAFFSQMSDGAGAGAWTTGVTAILCLLILALSFKFGTKDITRSDKVMLAGVVGATFLFIIVRNALLSIILVTLSTHNFAAIKHFISIFALEKISLITALYPSAVFLANLILVGVLIKGRKK